MSPRILIFGASGTVGMALARMFAERGQTDRLVLVDHKNEPLEALGKELGAHTMTKDATDAAQVKDVFDMHRDEGICAVINTVGPYPGPLPLAEADIKTWTEVMHANVIPAFNILKEATSSMTAGGSIVAISAAVGAHHGLKNHEIFAAAKAAVEGMYISAAATYAPKDIRINIVAPGLVKSAKADEAVGTGPQDIEKFVDIYPLRRIADAREVAAAAAFLVHPDAAFITGQVLAVDGGLSSLTPHCALHQHGHAQAMQHGAKAPPPASHTEHGVTGEKAGQAAQKAY